MSLLAPSLRFDPASLETTGSVVTRLASSSGLSRADLMEAAGLSRVTLAQRLNALVVAGLVREHDDTVPSGGRPTKLLGLCDDAGCILAADVGEQEIRLAVTDLSGAILRRDAIDFRPADDPVATMLRIAAGLETLLRPDDPFVAGVGISLPAPVDHRAGHAVGPSILRDWDHFPVAGWMAGRFDAPAFAENDVNLITIHEHRAHHEGDDAFLFVKVGTGIGSGIMTEGRLYRGAQGAAGDLGHIQFFGDHAPPLCRCGKLGCLEARAAGWALARDLRSLGFEAHNARDVIGLVERGEPEAIALVRAAGRAVGEALSDAVGILNPARIVVGGTLARAGEPLMEGIRELVGERCLPLATRDLVLTASPTPDHACLVGAAICVRERVFSAAGIDRFLGRYGRWYAARAS